MAKTPKIKIKLTRDYWFEADVRTFAGTVVAVDEDVAKIAMDSGLATFVGVGGDDEPAAK